MADAAEVPEAKDPFERRVALTIAILAVVLSVVSMKGDNAKGDGLLNATQASNQWAYYQAKSIKEHTYALQLETLQLTATAGEVAKRREEVQARYAAEVARYKAEKDEIRKQAESHEEEVVANARVNDRCDLAGLLLQIAIILGSVAILVRWAAFWGVSIVVGIAGAVAGATAWFL